jgi:hypothetical protein
MLERYSDISFMKFGFKDAICELVATSPSGLVSYSSLALALLGRPRDSQPSFPFVSQLVRSVYLSSWMSLHPSLLPNSSAVTALMSFVSAVSRSLQSTLSSKALFGSDYLFMVGIIKRERERERERGGVGWGEEIMRKRWEWKKRKKTSGGTNKIE